MKTRKPAKKKVSKKKTSKKGTAASLPAIAPAGSHLQRAFEQMCSLSIPQPEAEQKLTSEERLAKRAAEEIKRAQLCSGYQDRAIKMCKRIFGKDFKFSALSAKWKKGQVFVPKAGVSHGLPVGVPIMMKSEPRHSYNSISPSGGENGINPVTTCRPPTPAEIELFLKTAFQFTAAKNKVLTVLGLKEKAKKKPSKKGTAKKAVKKTR